MKRIIILIMTGITFLVILTGCSPNRSIVKRHYTGGYYIAHNSGKQQVGQHSKDRSVAAICSLPQKNLENSTGTETAEIQVGGPHETLVSAQSNSDLKNVKPEVKQLRPHVRHKLSPLSYKINQPQGNVFKPAADTAREALSLLWIIILIILAVWVVAFLLGGPGVSGLIHLLLVIALVLFILWLLRIL